ncbi:MAG: T9SS type A sorting domain-containing protein [Bacteroidia bacterium]|nr:T9SS type A sorting domain-containing protein [Bacteroidia bacterium]
MKKYILLLLLIAFFTPCKAQPETVPSSCTAPDSIVNLFSEDAARLALRRVYRNYSSYKDSINIPMAWRETTLRSLLAVYNANSLPARDTVLLSSLNIHTLVNFHVNDIILLSDSNLPWAKQLCNSGFPSGYALLDTFITRHFLTLDGCYYNFAFHKISFRFKSDRNYNIHALGKLSESIPNVNYYAQGLYFDGPDITDSVYANFTELVFAYKWGDCFNGCTKKRYWKFHVYPDCSVEYLGSYGNQLTGEILSAGHVAPNQIKCYPNPFTNTIVVEGATGKFYYRISDFTGKLHLEGIAENVVEVNSDLPSGMYFLRIQTDEGISVLKLVKQ